MKKLEDYIYYEEKDPELKIYLGNCAEIMPLLENIELVLTDPPYGIKADLEMHKKSGQQYGNAAAPKGNYDFSDWDSKAPPIEIFDMIRNLFKNQIIFGGNFFPLPPTRCLLIWDKQNGSNNFADCEVAWTNLDAPIRIKRHMWNGMLRKNGEERYGHPTQKPTEVMQWCLGFVRGNFLDPFMGSGSTLVAGKELNRNGIGIEISEKYCEIAKKRLKATCKPLFTDVSGAKKSLKIEETQNYTLFPAV